MSESTWIYKWIDSKGIKHISASYTEANTALHNHCLVLGSRVNPAPEKDFLDELETP